MHATNITSPSSPSTQNSEKIRKVATDFESLFTSMMLRSMRKTVGDNPLIPAGFGEKIYTDMLDDEYSKMVGKHASLGLADMIVKELERNNTQQSSLGKLDNLNTIEPWMLDSRLVPQNVSVPEGKPAAMVKKWDKMVSEAGETYDVDKNLISAVIAQESAGNPYAVSRAGAKGLMQLMDTTAQDMGVSHSFSPKSNIQGGVKYLRKMLDQFNGDEELALAAYNAGPSAVKKYNGIPPYSETINYVKSVLRLKKQFSKD